MINLMWEAALDLIRDLEVLAVSSEDVAQRIPEGRPIADVLARLNKEGPAIFRDLRTYDERRAYRWVGDLVEALARERAAALTLLEGAACGQDDNAARVQFLIRNFNLAYHLAYRLADELQLRLAWQHAGGVDVEISVRLDRDLAGDLADNTESQVTDDVASALDLRPGRQALRLVDVIVRFLPPGQRERYGEELRAELYGLAERNRPYGAQLLYVLRQFNRVFELRHELRRPSPRRLSP
ncbi:hypothetical protein AB0L34_03985 [Micromonospora sp. NPDC052213]|uniref:hypothetical protein n=1 Tax=Micromonospora sp. NPDC052213 TaxID=3155812 RepID=UPI00341459CD